MEQRRHIDLSKYNTVCPLVLPGDTPHIHFIPLKTAHLVDRELTCWCRPELFFELDQLQNPKADLFIHQPYTPKGENGDGIR